MRSIIPLAVALLAVATAAPQDKRQEEDTEPVQLTTTMINSFFASLKPSPKLTWTTCFTAFTCALLEVPLDYEDEAAGKTTVPFIRYSTGNPNATDILVDNGGPGGSAVEFVAFRGPGLLAVLAGKSTAYNLVGFDPRGVGNSGINLDCFYGNQTLQDDYDRGMRYQGSLPSAEAFQLSQAKGEYCSKTNKDTNAKYAGTVAVVQDMHHYIRLQAEAKGQPADEAKLFYWGISYGTIIGQTYATMFPNNVGRMILDANVNGIQYYAGHHSDAASGMDLSFRAFFKYCHEAGPKLCSFAGNSTSPKDLEDRYFKIMNNLKESPILMSDPATTEIPYIITHNDILYAIFMVQYSPAIGYPTISKVLTLLESDAAPPLIKEALDAAEEPIDNPQDSNVMEMISCIDGGPRYHVTIKSWKSVHEYYKKQSVFFGDGIALTNGLQCAGFSIKPPKSQVFPGFKTTKTSAPILFVGTTADPITPIANAHAMSKFFPGSAVLTVNAPGHSFISAASQCAVNAVLAYMTTGQLPMKGATCDLDRSPFEAPVLSKRLRKRLVPRRRF